MHHGVDWIDRETPCERADRVRVALAAVVELAQIAMRGDFIGVSAALKELSP
jgi:hypothetical protein